MIKLVVIAVSTICAVGPMMPACAARPEPAADNALVDIGSSDAASLQPAFATTIGDRVFFGFDGFTLSQEARAILSRQAAWLSRHGQLGVVIAGNCDALEARHCALDLAARRADAVFEYLSAQGIAFIRIRKVSYGVDRPLDTGTTEAALARNRSAQIILVGLSSR